MNNLMSFTSRNCRPQCFCWEVPRWYVLSQRAQAQCASENPLAPRSNYFESQVRIDFYSEPDKHFYCNCHNILHPGNDFLRGLPRLSRAADRPIFFGIRIQAYILNSFGYLFGNYRCTVSHGKENTSLCSNFRLSIDSYWDMVEIFEFIYEN